MKLYCDNCGHIFDEADAIIEQENPAPRDISLPMVYEYYRYCPKCGEDFFDPAHECELCGEWHSPHEGDLCKECEKEVDMAIKQMISGVAANHEGNFKRAENAIMERIAMAW